VAVGRTGLRVLAGVGLGVPVTNNTPTVGGGDVGVVSRVNLGVAVAFGVIAAVGVAVLAGRGEAVLVAGGRVLVGASVRGRAVEAGPIGSGLRPVLAFALGVALASGLSPGGRWVDSGAGGETVSSPVTRATTGDLVGGLVALASWVALGTGDRRKETSGGGPWRELDSCTPKVATTKPTATAEVASASGRR